MLRMFLFFCLLKNLNTAQALDNASKKYKKKMEIEKKIKECKEKMLYWGIGFVFFSLIEILTKIYMPDSFLKNLIDFFLVIIDFICAIMFGKFFWLKTEKERHLELLLEHPDMCYII